MKKQEKDRNNRLAVRLLAMLLCCGILCGIGLPSYAAGGDDSASTDTASVEVASVGTDSDASIDTETDPTLIDQSGSDDGSAAADADTPAGEADVSAPDAGASDTDTDSTTDTNTASTDGTDSAEDVSGEDANGTEGADGTGENAEGEGSEGESSEGESTEGETTGETSEVEPYTVPETYTFTGTVSGDDYDATVTAYNYANPEYDPTAAAAAEQAAQEAAEQAAETGETTEENTNLLTTIGDFFTDTISSIANAIGLGEDDEYVPAYELTAELTEISYDSEDEDIYAKADAIDFEIEDTFLDKGIVPSEENEDGELKIATGYSVEFRAYSINATIGRKDGSGENSLINSDVGVTMSYPYGDAGCFWLSAEDAGYENLTASNIETAYFVELNPSTYAVATDDNGNLKITEISASNITGTVIGTDGLYAIVVVVNEDATAADSTVTIKAGASDSTTQITFDLDAPSASGTLTGSCTDASGNTVDGIKVEAGTPSTTSTDRGSKTFTVTLTIKVGEDVAAGTYTYTYSYSYSGQGGNSSGTKTGTVTIVVPDETNVKIEQGKSGTLTVSGIESAESLTTDDAAAGVTFSLEGTTLTIQTSYSSESTGTTTPTGTYTIYNNGTATGYTFTVTEKKLTRVYIYFRVVDEAGKWKSSKNSQSWITYGYIDIDIPTVATYEAYVDQTTGSTLGQAEGQQEDWRYPKLANSTTTDWAAYEQQVLEAATKGTGLTRFSGTENFSVNWDDVSLDKYTYGTDENLKIVTEKSEASAQYGLKVSDGATNYNCYHETGNTQPEGEEQNTDQEGYTWEYASDGTTKNTIECWHLDCLLVINRTYNLDVDYINAPAGATVDGVKVADYVTIEAAGKYEINVPTVSGYDVVVEYAGDSNSYTDNNNDGTVDHNWSRRLSSPPTATGTSSSGEFDYSQPGKEEDYATLTSSWKTTPVTNKKCEVVVVNEDVYVRVIYTPKTYSINLTKTVSGPEASELSGKSYTFKVYDSSNTAQKFELDATSGNYELSTAEGASETITISFPTDNNSLSKTVTLTGLSATSYYAVETTSGTTITNWSWTGRTYSPEATTTNGSNEEVTDTTKSGTVTLTDTNQTGSITVTNTYVKYGSITVTKAVNVEGGSESDAYNKTFTFTLEKTEDGGTTWTTVGTAQNLNFTNTGKTVTFSNLEAGTYRVVESDPTNTLGDNYLCTGTSIQVGSGNAKNGLTSDNASVTAGNDTTITVTNNYAKYYVLTVQKKLSGNFYISTDTFQFTIKSNKAMKINTTGTRTATLDTNKKATVTLGMNDTVKLLVPAGANVTITEGNASSGYTYTMTGSSTGSSNVTVNGQSATLSSMPNSDTQVTITNTRTTEVDNGVLLDSAPYIVLLAVVAAAAVVIVVRRRRTREDD